MNQNEKDNLFLKILVMGSVLDYTILQFRESGIGPVVSAGYFLRQLLSREQVTVNDKLEAAESVDTPFLTETYRYLRQSAPSSR